MSVRSLTVLHALSGAIVVDTGHIDADTRKDLNREIRSGSLVKWRGHWFPIAGASHGIGPLKTCYGTPEAKALVSP